MDMLTKPCSRCKVEKPLEEFHKDPKSPTGKAYFCKSCVKANCKYWWDKNRLERLARKKEYYLENKVAILAHQKEYIKANRETAREGQRRWRRENRERARENSRNKEATRRALKAQCQGRHTVREWQRLVKQYGNRCLRCGKKGEATTLTRDHVVPLSKGGKNSIDNIQPLCQNCNATKHVATFDYRVEYHLDW